MRNGDCPLGKRCIAVCYIIEMLRPCFDASSTEEDDFFFGLSNSTVIKRGRLLSRRVMKLLFNQASELDLCYKPCLLDIEVETRELTQFYWNMSL